jgi:tRNA threonylcarbamoyladenosine biosynthesis protein TsaB
MIVLGFDTATRASAVGLMLDGNRTLRARDDPGEGEHPGHATRLLGMADELLSRGGIDWSAIERIAVGVGPGTFTGLRVGVATARGLAQSLSIELVGISSALALASATLQPAAGEAGAGGHAHRMLAVIDARRGQVFAGAYGVTGGGSLAELVPPRAIAPELIGEVAALAEEQGADGGAWVAAGDGALRYRAEIEMTGATVPEDSSSLHRIDAGAICRLGLRARPVSTFEQVLPDYRRRPDAEIALEAVAERGGERLEPAG